MFSVGLIPVSRKKNEVEVEMIKCFELTLYQSRESRTKKRLSEDSVSPSVFIS